MPRDARTPMHEHPGAACPTPHRTAMKQPRPVAAARDRQRPADLRSLLSGYLACPSRERPPSFFAFVRERNPHVFSHHAHDRADYAGHVWCARGLFLCRGCTTVLVVTPLAFGIALLTRWPVNIPTLATASIFAALLAMSLAPLRDGPRTLLHDIRRAALGCLLGSATAYLMLCDDWLLRAVVVGVYLAVLAARRLARNRS